MNLEHLLSQYSEDARLKQLSGALLYSERPLHIHIHNAKGSSASIIAATIWNLTKSTPQKEGLNFVYVLEDKENAAYFQNDLEQLTNGLDHHFFPDSFKKDGNFEMLHTSHIMLRTEALSKFLKERRSAVLVTYPQALMELVVQHQNLKNNSISIKVNQKLDVIQLLERLVTVGFRKEDFVYEPGQFAVRGGILDLYSFGNEKPYRIELFGNEVDSIRIFDAETQLSERKLINVTILPGVSQSNDEVNVSLMDFLPANTVFCFADKDKCLAQMQHYQSQIFEFVQSQKPTHNDTDETFQKQYTIHDFESPKYFEDRLAAHHVIEWNAIKNESKINNSDEVNIFFETEHQPQFNRNFDLLISDLLEKNNQKYQLFIAAENARQIERLHNIFAEKNLDITFTGIPIALHRGFIDNEQKIIVYTDHQIFQRYHKYRIKQSFTKSQALTLKALRDLQPGDYVTHIDHGVGRYSGLQKIEVNGNMQEAIRIIYKDNDILYVNINALHKISKFTGKDGAQPKIHKLGSDAWDKLKQKTKRQVKDIAADLIKLYAKRKASNGFAHSPDNYLQYELEASFLYEDTPDQSKATVDVKKDMEAPHPMDRLVCGDVGFGKTEIALRAAFKTVNDSKQAAVLVPTTILAYQHFQTFKKRLEDFPVTVDYLNRFKSTTEKKETLQRLKEGKIDIIIGTHALLSKEVVFKNLGLLIVDEEQKFGVAAKEKIREKRVSVDTLTLTATPIPRTLQFSLMAARDLSIINTPPPNRQPVSTELIGFNEETIRDAIYYEVERGGQVYFIHNRVQSLESMAEMIRTLCPDVSVGIAHGQMDGKRLEQTLVDFIEQRFDVLCCTNIVESGVDISNANTIIINNAHQFGLSDLHQLRGRVGRSNKKAFCYLVAPSLITLPSESRRRLQTLEQFSDLGSGFQIAMRDLDIRGAGNLLGGEQSGFISDIGFEMYQKILAQAITELKRSDFRDVFAEELKKEEEFVQDCMIDTDLEILIPDAYVENITERLSLYATLDEMESEDEIDRFGKQLIDRFGPLPSQVEELLTTIKTRKLAKELGFEKLILKNSKLLLYFINNPESPFYDSPIFEHIMTYIQNQILNAQVKQTPKHVYLSVMKINSMQEAFQMMKNIIDSFHTVNAD